ncbi:MAG: hypothetical protein LQ338_003769 [Usnochroma carphineum]|nr:MAG: hypothetical protein LQ338_003769 [Usnochroma carphineum]
MLDDPTAPVIYRTSGAPPYPTPSNPQIPPSITPRQVTLRDRITIASLIPFSHANDVPHSLLNYLCSQFNLEIEKGDTYPMISPMPLSTFGPYWFQNFAAIMILGEVQSVEHVADMESRGVDWGQVCLGSFYVKPNYPAVTSATEAFLSLKRPEIEALEDLWVKLVHLKHKSLIDLFKGYTYSVFNLVYETNVASCRIWDALGFKRIGRIKGCGNLRSYPDELVDAIIYGRDLGSEGEDFVTEERFDKIRFYLKHGKYPNGADRAEKSRLRSAATHYKLLPAEDGSDAGERLMLKDKEVVSDHQRQYEIARQVHALQHGGINKTTATIAERYHWVRIKETVSLVIKNCPDCKESIRPAPSMGSFNDTQTSAGAPPLTRARRENNNSLNQTQDTNNMMERLVDFTDVQSVPSGTGHMHDNLSLPAHAQPDMDSMADLHHHLPASPSPYDNLPLDPQIIQSPTPPPHEHHHHQTHPHDSHPSDELFEDQLRRATQGHSADDAHYDLDLSSAHPDGLPDTRMATGRHVRQHDEPMTFIHETGEDGDFEIGRKDIDRSDEEGMHEELVDFDGRGV